jgi:hypothetical protein
MDQFLGFFELSSDLVAAVAIAPPTGVPVDPTVNPTYRVYDGDTLLPNGTGSLAKMDTGTVTNATNVSPIVVTSNAHGLKTGNVVKITGVGGNTAANATFVVTYVSDNTFSLDGSTGNGAYTSGGAWHVLGLYSLSLTLANGAGYEKGKMYTVRIDWQNSGNFAKVLSFQVT